MEDGEAISRLGLKSIKCILCHQVSSCSPLTPPPQVILLAELPPTQYITHLMSAHEVLFDLEFLVQRTLQQQHPELAKSAAGLNCIDKTGKPAAKMEPGQRRSLEENASRMQEIFPQSITITPILKRKGSEERSDSKRRRGGEEEEVVHVNGDAEDEVGKSPTECEPSWSLGCLYRCAICSVKFQTLTSFQSHLFFHRTTPEQYLAQHGESFSSSLAPRKLNGCYFIFLVQGDPGVQFQHHACLRCGEMVQQDPLHLRLHLITHGLNLAQYTSLLEAEGRGSSSHSGEGEVVSSASSTSKSSPGVHQARQSVDNMSESQGSSKEGEKEEKEDDVAELEEDVDEMEDGEASVKAEPITTEPDIELSYFSPSHENDFPVFPGAADLEGEVTQNIIRDLTKSAETFFHQQRSFQQQRSFHSQYFPGLMHVPRTQYSAGRIAWYHGCLFQCSIESCTRQFFEKVFLKAHVESQHRGINFDQYLLDFGNANTVIHHHECELCGMGILHTAR